MLTIPGWAWSTVSVCSRSLAGIVISNPAMDMDRLTVVCFHVEVSPSADHSSRGVLPSMVSECDREASTTRRPWPTKGYCAIQKGALRETLMVDE
jgi:hypothetical protein